jgi:hypothetical protein
MAVSTDISVLKPLMPSFRKTGELVFRSFSLLKWLMLSFAAWLANLGLGESLGYRTFHVKEIFRRVKHPEAVIIYIGLVLILWILTVWVSSRGKFVFLEDVAAAGHGLKVPWRKFAAEGDSLFYFRIVLALFLVLSVVVLIFFLQLFSLFLHLAGRGAAPGSAAILTVVVLSIFWAAFYRLLEDFIIPFMYLKRLKAKEAAALFFSFFKRHQKYFYLYLVFQIIIGFGALCMIYLVNLITFRILLLPFVSTAVLLPVYVFVRVYPLNFLRQFGEEYDVWNAIKKEK